MPKHDAVYVRVSSRAQDTRSQLPDLRAYTSAKHEPVCWYEDKFSGKTMDRPGWLNLEAAIRRLKEDGVPLATIARTVGLSRPTVYSVLEGATL